MITITELTEWFEDLRRIISDLHISVNNAYRLGENKYEEEERIKQHGFFQHHWHQLIFIMIVQICKILDDNSNQRRNFHKLIRRLETDKLDPKILELLNTNSSSLGRVFRSREELMQGLINIKKNLEGEGPTIFKVVTLRNKVFAHKDPNFKSIEGLSLTDIKRLIELSTESFNIIRGGIVDAHFSFEITGDWDVDFILRNMCDNRKKIKEAARK